MKVQKILLEQAKIITVFSQPAALSVYYSKQHYVGGGRTGRRCSLLPGEWGDRRQDKSAPLASNTEDIDPFSNTASW